MTGIDTSPEAIAAIMDGVTDAPWELRGKQTIGVGVNTVAKCGWKNGRKDAPFIVAARQLVPALAAENAVLRADLASLKQSETDLLNEVERLRAWIAEFAAADFDPLPLPPKGHPEDEVEAATDALPVWAWQQEAEMMLKGAAND